MPNRDPDELDELDDLRKFAAAANGSSIEIPADLLPVGETLEIEITVSLSCKARATG